MAAEKQAPASSLPLGSIATLLLFVAGVIIPNVPLESQRPRELEPAKDRIVGIQDADARLWQDPFSAAARHLSKIEKLQDLKSPKLAQDDPNHSCARLRKSGRIILKGYKNLVVLGVMVIGSPYAEAAELRRRYRYATLSALGTFGFIPTDPENIGYFVPPQSQGYSPSSGIIPFEFLVPARGGGPGVLLLWLEEEAFVGPLPPLDTLNNLLRMASPEGGVVCTEDGTPAPRQPGAIAYKVVGPVSSTVLKYMLEQVKGTPDDASGERKLRELVAINGAPVEIYSASATSALESFLERPSGKSTNMPTEQLENRMNLVRAIGTDTKLAEYLMAELERRGIFPGKLEEEGDSRHYIALISEWDEVYGQQLPITITDAARAACIKGKVKQHCGDEEPEWAIRYSYMRGLDGQTAADPGTRDKAAGRDKNNLGGAEKTPGATPIERADGNSQFDYLRRLASTLEERNARLKRAGKGEIKAVGVLGTDAYDKLLVLQALRKSLPKATFFTTDLDARLLHTDQYQWSRNLIVASSFGLTLDPALQKSIPPFRDSYQTAVYLATLLALNQNDMSQKREKIKHWLDMPRIFEIGRTRAIDLSDPVSKEQLRECAPDNLWNCMRVHPERAVTQPGLAALGILTALLVLGAALLYRCSWKTKIFLHRYWFCVLTVYALLLGLGWLFSRFILNDPRQEPFVLIEGISMWPTELIRLAVCGLAVAFIFRGCQMLKQNTAEINAEFFPQQTLMPQKSDTSSSSWKRMEHDDSPVDMLKLWREYLYHCRPKRVSRRVSWAAIIFCVLSGLLVLLDLPMVPYRGDLSLWVDKAVLFLSIASFVVLLFFVLDQIRLGDRLVRVLYAAKSAWPKETMQKHNVKNDSGREWIDIQFVAKRTEVVGKLVYYPFVVLVLLIVARSSLFDHWYLPYGLAAVFALSLLFTIAVAIQLRRSAEHARAISLQRLFRLRLQHLGARKTSDAVQKQTEAIIAEISAIRTGAFRPFTEQPLVQAILIPLGGYGGISLIEYMAFLK